MSVKFKNNVEVDGFVATEAVKLDASPTQIPTEQGSMYFDEDEETLAVVLNGTIQKVGEDLFFQIKNQTGVTIPRGTVVRFAGVLGASGRLLAVPFLANGTYPSLYFLGVTSEDILNGGDGKAFTNGKIKGLNTSAFPIGTILYASTTVAGGFQSAAPIAPNNIISVAAVIAQSATVGTLLIRPQLGSNINSDEGIKIVSVADKNLLQYQSASGLWENKTLAQVINSSYVPSTRTITINGTTQDLSVNRTFNVGSVTSIGVTAGPRIISENGPITSSGNITISHGIGQGLDVQGAQDLSNRAISDGGTFEAFRCLATSLGELGDFQTPLGTFNSSGSVIQNIMLDDFGHILGVGSKTLYTKDIIEDTNLYFTNARSRASISLTTTTTSGASTYNNSTGVINIPQYQAALTNPITGTGTSGQVSFFNGTTTQTGDSALFWDNTNKRLGIGTASPGYRLDVNGSAYIRSDFWVPGDNGLWFNNNSYTAGITGRVGGSEVGIFAGSSERMRVASNGNVGIGTTSPGTYKLNVNGTFNATGDALVNGLTVGRGGGNNIFNTVFGSNALLSNTTGNQNTAYGTSALQTNTTGTSNTTNGLNSLFHNTIGSSNTGNGVAALFNNTTGNSNTGNGVGALFGNTTGNSNIAIGQNAGRYIANGTTANTITNNSIYLGFNTKASADNQTNQIVIGHDVIGLGSNTTVLGNTSTITTALYGNVGIGTTITNHKLHVNGATQLGNINATINFNTVALKVVEGTISTGPTLGLGTVGAQAVLYSNGLFGMYTGVSSNGSTWMQSQRNDAETSTYNILLNPLGGFVGVGTAAPTHTLHVVGTTKVSSLAGTGTRNVVVDGNGVLSASSSPALSYKVYTALLSQNGTSAPVATVLENTLGGEVVWSRTSTGVYLGTSLGSAFTTNKSMINISTGYNSTLIARYCAININGASIATSYGGSPADGQMGNDYTSIEIRVYN